MLLLVPAGPLRPRRVDEHFAAETAAARDAGVTVALIDHDALAGPGDAERAVARVPRGDGDGDGAPAVYRGWMLSGRQYEAFADALADQGVALRTSTAQYRKAHELPGWYPALAPVTPEAAWTAGGGEPEFRAACARLGPGPAVLRDYVKSMKHYWHEAAYIPDLADHTAAWQVAARFRELREDDFAGGFVLRRFEHFVSAEARTWWVGGTCQLTTPHPDTPDELPPEIDLTPFAPLIRSLALPFVTADLARRADGTWRVIGLGDGQVSDRPVTTDPGTFIGAVLLG
jgi:ATP-grasp domain, R2K clade family 3